MPVWGRASLETRPRFRSGGDTGSGATNSAPHMLWSSRLNPQRLPLSATVPSMLPSRLIETDVTLEYEVTKYVSFVVRVIVKDAPEQPSPTTSWWLSANLGSARRTNAENSAATVARRSLGLLIKDPHVSPGLPPFIVLSWASATLEPSACDRSQPVHRSAAIAIDTDQF